MIDSPHHVLAACGADEEVDSGPTGFGANAERILREALTTEKYLTIGGMYDQLLAAVKTKKMENVPVFQWPRIHSPTSTDVLLAPKKGTAPGVPQQTIPGYKSEQEPDGTLPQNSSRPMSRNWMTEAEVRMSGLELMRDRIPGTSMVISFHCEDDGAKEDIDMLGHHIRQITMMDGVEVDADVGQGKVVPITFQAGDSCYILVQLDARVYYHLEPHPAWRLAFGPCDALPVLCQNASSR